MNFGTGKSRDVLWRACRTARRDPLVTTSETDATRTSVQGRRHSINWVGHVHLNFTSSCFWDWCKSREQKTKLVHASTTASSSPAMLEQARCDALVTMRKTRTTRHDTHDTCAKRRDISWRDVTSGISAYRLFAQTVERNVGEQFSIQFLFRHALHAAVHWWLS